MTMVGAIAIAMAPAVASAADTWTEPHPGVRMLARTTNTPWRIWALEIDLCASGVSLRATKSDERQRTASSFAGLVDADAAINGDFFSFATYATSGLSVGAGEPWSDTADSNGDGFVAFGNDRAELKMTGTHITAAAGWMKNVVSGHPGIVKNGEVDAPASELCTARHPRTAAGVSEDGRTLYLAVVDGRTSISVGMTCGELGNLMKGLGAWSAINLDGGGSTTMWVKGEGVVNSPSDGVQRVVANHLGVFASGAGDPGSCDRSWEESAVHGDAYDSSTTSDIDGDGDADVCVRTPSGIECALAEDGAFAAAVPGPGLSDDSGWADPSNFATLRMGDLDGDGRADLCARANAGMRCWLSEGDAFTEPAIEGPALADDVGWASPAYHGTLRMADVDGNGTDDLCVRSASDFRCYPAVSTGGATGFGDPWTLPDLADAEGFGAPSRYGTIRMADVDGDNRDDVCARAAEGMRCWPSTGSGFAAAIEGPAWSDANGWGRPEYWSTIRLVDLDADGRADLCGRTATGLQCHLADDAGFGEAILGPGWADDNGWGDYDNYSTIRFADIDGDGDSDVCGRANAGIVCFAWTGDGFASEAITGPALADDTGWNNVRFYATIRLVDFDGDGMADVCARASDGLHCWRSTGTGFEEGVLGPAWSDAAGFDAPEVYETLRAVRPMRRCVVDEACNGDDDDCDGMIDEGCPVDGGEDDDSGGTDGAGSAGGTEGASGDTEPGDTQGGTDTVDAGLPPGFGADDEGGCACRARGDRRAGHVALGLAGMVILLLGARGRHGAVTRVSRRYPRR
jgi:hypothetical protein